jgi:N-acetyl-gamma-glutamyl-phosphate reductase
MADSKARIGILGASGYTGGEALRILLTHPRVEIKALTADRHAGKPLAQVWPQFTGIELPGLVKIYEIDPSALDLVFAALPHGATQTVMKGVLEKWREL